MKNHTKHVCWLLGASMAVCAFRNGTAGEPPKSDRGAWDVASDTWVATDGLGRAVPGHDECGPTRPGKYVGMFYFLWLGTHGRDLYDISKILAANPPLSSDTAPQFGPRGAFHWWGEPLFGHYLSDDAWVIRKHAQMLQDAGVDVLFFDATNGYTYETQYLTVCRVFQQIRESGQDTPQIAFLANSSSAAVVARLYRDFYAKSLYQDLWFRWQGKPLLLTPEDGLSQEIKGFFTLRRSWAWTDPNGWFGDGRDKWPWVDHHPQKPGWHENAKVPEQVSVCTAQHPVTNIGRSFHGGKQPPVGQTATDRGLCFTEQWGRALKVDPQMVFVTGWNEWVAQRFISDTGGQSFLGKRVPPGGTYFVDQYSQEFSRDIEPMKGGHTDHYYYQLVANIRRFKGARPLPPVTPRPITIDGRFDDWNDVGPEFRDTLGDTLWRDHPGYDPQQRYVNRTGRNDLAAAKVSWDSANVYFLVRTHKRLSPPSDPNWMLLFLDADSDPTTGWLGYDFVVNHGDVKPNVTTLRKNVEGRYAWAAPIEIAWQADGNRLELAIPRSALGAERLPGSIDFKWADNTPQTGQLSEFTVQGDAAPNDRFNYRAKLRSD